MQARHYAQALYDLSASREMEEGKLVKQFVRTVQANGHAHLIPKILRSFERLQTREERKQTIEVQSARILSQEEGHKLLKREPFKQAISASHKKVIRKTDDTLVGGAVVRAGGVRVDASHKRALVDLYQSLISS